MIILMIKVGCVALRQGTMRPTEAAGADYVAPEESWNWRTLRSPRNNAGPKCRFSNANLAVAGAAIEGLSESMVEYGENDLTSPSLHLYRRLHPWRC